MFTFDDIIMYFILYIKHPWSSVQNSKYREFPNLSSCFGWKRILLKLQKLTGMENNIHLILVAI